ncbi:MAG: diacylglycerol/lipid kinase family protein [Methyloceanibacter sp.]|uniref:diacylglycerol/lipid kinase family protein n=1 Tax=Methyloceanibacter sp. TaxID=1965321 RepID=UPI003D6C91D4
MLNARAGGAGKPVFETLEHRAKSAFAAHRIQTCIELVDGSQLKGAITRALEQAKQGEIDAIVIGGGDGSVHTAASLLARSDVPLGVLPLGTLNHFAKDLGLPLDIESAAAVIARGRSRLVDLGKVNGETFVNNSSIGIYPYLVMDRERRRARKRLRKWMAMVPAFFRMLRHLPWRRLRISAEGFERPYRTPCVFVGNNEYGTDLFTLGRRRRLDTGKLWFYVVKPRSPLGLFWIACRMCFSHLDPEGDLDTFELSEAEIAAKSSRLPVALDGEVRVLHTPLHYRSLPKALRVIAP